MNANVNTSHQQNRPKRSLLSVQALLAYLLIVTLLFTGVTLARYHVSSRSRLKARAAKFEFTAQAGGNSDITLMLDEEDSEGNYNFTVTSNSETSVIYRVTVACVGQTGDPVPLPEGVLVKMDGSQTGVIGEDGLLTFEGGVFLSTDTVRTRSHKLTFTVDEAAQQTIEQTIEQTLTVYVTCEQLD